MSNRLLPCLLAAIAVPATLTGCCNKCQTYGPSWDARPDGTTAPKPIVTPLSPEQLLEAATKVKQAAAQVKDPSSPVQAVLEQDLIDIHVHTFNHRYLPLEEIGAGKAPCKGIPSWLGRLFGVITACRTPAIEGTEHTLAGEPTEEDLREAYRLSAEYFIQKHSGNKQALIALNENEELNALLDKLSERCKHEVKITTFLDEPLLAELGVRTGLLDESSYMLAEGTVHPALVSRFRSFERNSWLDRLDTVGNLGFMLDGKRKDSEVDDRFRWRFEFDDNDRLEFAITHMMDLAPVYAQKPDDKLFITFNRQLDRMSTLQQETDHDMAFFVAYNPFRDHWSDRNGSPQINALEIVKKAITEHGALGVKFYPPSGYRAIDNTIPPRPSDEVLAAQWDARYRNADGSKLTTQELDRRVAELLDWCVEHEIPVFAHCQHGEFEPEPGYGATFSHPEYWRRYLEGEHPKTGYSRSDLILCLAHAGGADYWFGQPDHHEKNCPDAERWGALVAELCLEYPNVYCEIGVHDQITGDEGEEITRQHRFVARVLAVEESLLDDNRSFLSKIIYGSDWFMGSSVPRPEYIKSYQVAALAIGGAGFYDDFFRQNALDYLKASECTNGHSIRTLPDPVLDDLSRLLRMWSGSNE